MQKVLGHTGCFIDYKVNERVAKVDPVFIDDASRAMFVTDVHCIARIYFVGLDGAKLTSIPPGVRLFVTNDDAEYEDYPDGAEFTINWNMEYVLRVAGAERFRLSKQQRHAIIYKGRALEVHRAAFEERMVTEARTIVASADRVAVAKAAHAATSAELAEAVTLELAAVMVAKAAAMEACDACFQSVSHEAR
jgi:hypothetical protein